MIIKGVRMTSRDVLWKTIEILSRRRGDALQNDKRHAPRNDAVVV